MMQRFIERSVLFAASALAVLAADRIAVYRAQLAGPMGTDSGKIVMTGDQLIFVDDARPEMSFAIPRSDIGALRLEDGILTLNMNRPFNGVYGSASAAALRFIDPESPGLIASWTGIPLAGGALGGPDRFGAPPASSLMFNVTHDDDTGRLIVGAQGLDFEALSNAKKSRGWSYSQIKEFKRDPDDHKLKLKTYRGEEFTFRVSGAGMNADIYNLIADRIIAARRN